MSRNAPIKLPPSALDLALARQVASHATKPLEQSLTVATWLADEKLILAGAAVFWTASRCRSDPATRRHANHIVACAVVSSALPHLFKRLIARERPDRKVVHGFRRGVPRSGNAWDSFPSGHALHLGALAAAASRMVGPPARRFVWPTAIAFAATRLLLLAHYLSDVAAGLVLGIAVDRGVSCLLEAFDQVTAAGTAPGGAHASARRRGPTAPRAARRRAPRG